MEQINQMNKDAQFKKKYSLIWTTLIVLIKTLTFRIVEP